MLVTLLREPVDKLLGKYYFLRSRRADSGKGAPERGDPLASLELWADDCRHQNEYAQILGNAELPPAPPLGEGFACKRECAPPSAAQTAATRAAVERAKATLDEFDVVVSAWAEHLWHEGVAKPMLSNALRELQRYCVGLRGRLSGS